MADRFVLSGRTENASLARLYAREWSSALGLCRHTALFFNLQPDFSCVIDNNGHSESSCPTVDQSLFIYTQPDVALVVSQKHNFTVNDLVPGPLTF